MVRSTSLVVRGAAARNVLRGAMRRRGAAVARVSASTRNARAALARNVLRRAMRRRGAMGVRSFGRAFSRGFGRVAGAQRRLQQISSFQRAARLAAMQAQIRNRFGYWPAQPVVHDPVHYEFPRDY